MGICIDIWQALPGWFPTITLDEFVVMPNHTHFVVWLATVGAGLAPALVSAQHDAPAQQISPGATARVGATAGVRATARVRPYASQSRIHVYKGDHEKQPDENEAIAIPHDWEIPIPQTTKMNPTLGNVVGTWKSLVANTYLDWIKKHSLDRQAKFWQRNYYDQIIRNDRALEAIRHYIRMNPDRWSMDPDNPQNMLNLPFPETATGYIDDIKRHPHP